MLTAIDQIANQNHLQMIKASIPYLPVREQRMVAVYSKIAELQNILSFYSGRESSVVSCSLDRESSSAVDILNDIRTYCDPSEQEIIDRALQIITAMDLYSSMAAANPDSTQKGSTT
jgi:hypothetical protein